MMDWKEVALYLAAAAVTGLGGTGITLLISWIKTLKWVKKLNIDAVIDKAAELAIHFAEDWAKKQMSKVDGTAKLNAAREAFETELGRQGIKMDAGDMEVRLSGIFNKIKAEVEKSKKI